MITNFNLFENINTDEPKIGDWIIANLDFPGYHKDYRNVIENKIGQIVEKNDYSGVNLPDTYWVMYRNLTEKEKNIICIIRDCHQRETFRKEILFWSENKEDLEDILTAKKYNL